MFKEIKYVYAVYQEKSFTNAAKKLYISQPALSMIVKRAETKIGSPIFDRSTSPLTLTPVGRYYIMQAEKILSIQQEAAAYFRLMGQSGPGCIRISGAAVYQAYIFPPIIAAFKQQYPDAVIMWEEDRSANLLQKLLKGEINVFPEVNHYNHPQIARDIWKEEELLLVVPAQYAVNQRMESFRFTAEEIGAAQHLSAREKAVSLSCFKELEFILMAEENDTYRRAVSICRNAGFTPKQFAMTPAQMLTAYQLAAQGSGATFVSDTMAAHGEAGDRLYFYAIDDPLAKRPQYLYYKKEPIQSPMVQAFRAFLREYYS